MSITEHKHTYTIPIDVVTRLMDELTNLSKVYAISLEDIAHIAGVMKGVTGDEIGKRIDVFTRLMPVGILVDKTIKEWKP